MAQVLAPQLRWSLRRLQLAELEQLERAHDALAVTGLDSLGRPRRQLGQPRVERRRAVAFELDDEALAHARLRCRSQVELGEGRSEVKAGAADDDRPAPFSEQLVDLGVCEPCVLAGAE